MSNTDTDTNIDIITEKKIKEVFIGLNVLVNTIGRQMKLKLKY